MQTIKDNTLTDGSISEYRIKPVTRYVVTHYHENPRANTAGVSTIGEYDNYHAAEKVYNAFVHNPVAHEANYLITRIDTFEVTNEVYFASSLEKAQDLRDSLIEQSGDSWILAEIKD